MKMNTLRIIVIFLVAFTACKSNKKNTLITGDVGKTIQPEVVLRNEKHADTTTLTPDNKFRFNLNIENAGYFSLVINNDSYPLYITPYDTLNINLIDKVEFHGTARDINQYLFTKADLNIQHFSSLIQLFNLYPTEFLSKIDSVYNFHYNSLKNLNNNTKSVHFIEIEKKSLFYEKAQLMLEYASMSSNNYLINEAEYFNFIDDANINDSTLLNLPGYMDFLSAYVNWLSYNNTKDKEELFAHEHALIKMQLIARNFTQGIIKDKLIYSVLSEHIRFKGLKNTDLLFKTFLLQCKNKELQEKLMKPYKKYLSLNSGKKAPNFNIINLHNKAFNLNAFKGSYVYIDVWATWCKPCIKEAPYFEALKEEYTNKNIEFISLSIDKNKEKWVKYCKVNNKSDNQFWIENAQEFLDTYLIKTIPHFILIDEQGDIVKANANRPSDNNNEWLESISNKPEV